MKDPAALLYIDIWKSATTEMSAIERAYYMDMILHQYDKGSLPNNIEELANICRVRFSEYKQFEHVFEHVLKQKFELNTNGRLENHFASEIIRKRQKFLDKRSNAGKISYMIRFIKKHFKVKKDFLEWIKSNINFDEIDMKNEQVFKQVIEQKIELYINEDENEDINVDKDEKNILDFNTFWELYHSVTNLPKTDKDSSEKHWNKLKKSEQQKALDNIKSYYDSLNDKKYCKKARTYLSAKSFNDEFKIDKSNGETKYRFKFFGTGYTTDLTMSEFKKRYPEILEKDYEYKRI